MSLISLIQQLQTIQAQLSSPKFNAGEFGHLSQRYAALCASSVSVLQANQEKASASAAPQDLDPDLSLCSSSKLEHNLFLFQDRVKEFARQSAAAAEQLLPKSKPQPYSPPCSPVKRLLKAPSAPSTPASQLATLMQGRLALDASAAAVLKNPEYLQTQITALTNAISSKIAELSSLLEAERRKFQTKIQGFFPDGETQELAGDLFDIFYSTDQGEGALLQKVVHFIREDYLSQIRSRGINVDDYTFKVCKNLSDFEPQKQKQKKGKWIVFCSNAKEDNILYKLFEKGAELYYGAIKGDLYDVIIQNYQQQGKNKLDGNLLSQKKMKRIILNSVLREDPISPCDLEDYPLCLQQARFEMPAKHPKVFSSLGAGLSYDPGFYFKNTDKAKEHVRCFFKTFDGMQVENKRFQNFQAEKQEAIILSGFKEGALMALKLKKHTRTVYEYLGQDRCLDEEVRGRVLSAIETPSPVCFSFFLLQKKMLGQEEKEKICLVTVNSDFSKLKDGTQSHKKSHELFQLDIQKTVDLLNQNLDNEYKFEYYAKETVGVNLVLDQVSKVISGECKPLDVNSLNLQNPSRACAEKKMIAYWIAQIKDKTVESLEMEGSASFFKYIDEAQDKFSPCCQDCQINKIPVLIFFKHLQDKKAKAMLKQASDRVLDETAVADAACSVAAHPALSLSRLSAAAATDIDEAKSESGKQKKGKKLSFSCQ